MITTNTSGGLCFDGTIGLELRWKQATNWLRRMTVFAATVLAATVAHACGDGAELAAPSDSPRPTAVTVNPATARLASLGATVQLSAEVRDQNGNAMGGTTVTWSSSSTSVATVDASGLVTAVDNGDATVTATAGSASGTAVVTVAQEVAAVTVSPLATSVLVADTVRLSASATDANGHPVSADEFAWASSDTLVAVVDPVGLVTAISAGEAEITATSAGATGRARLTVVIPVPATVAVTSDTVKLTAFGQIAQLAAEVRDQAGRVMADARVSWSSGDTLVATVDSSGMVTAMGNGTAAITATAGSVSGEAHVTVTQSADSVFVSPMVNTISPGDTLRLAAEAFDSNGHTIDEAEFDWSSSDASVARVDASGLVTARAAGRATIIAAVGAVRGTSEITVATGADRDRLALVALYEATRGPSWQDNENWLSDRPLSAWYGVTTGASGRVVALELGDNGLVGGAIPPELGSLASLQYLDLGYNGLSGAIPPELGSLASLQYLDLGGNWLSGAIPPELGSLASLQYLDLGGNWLSGAIPPELGSLGRLRNLDLGYNRLSGAIPPELGSLVNLVDELSLEGNALSGAIPPELGNLANLWGLDLAENNLTGTVPPELGNLARVVRLFLQENSLTGAIPNSFLRLSRLKRFDWSHNAGLCAPDTAAFRSWLDGITDGIFPGWWGPFCAAVRSTTSIFGRSQDFGDGVLPSAWRAGGPWPRRVAERKQPLNEDHDSPVVSLLTVVNNHARPRTDTAQTER